MDPETKFFVGKLELDYGNKKVKKELVKISKKINWLKNWPENKKSFWNGEAFMWRNKISKEKRDLIKKELKFLERKGRNLDLGCGSHSYVSSVGFDISEKMLLLNDNLKESVIGNLEKRLPFKDKSFNSVTAVFLLNYVKNNIQLIKEINRSLKNKGTLMIVQSNGKVNSWQRQHSNNNFNLNKLKETLESTGFNVKSYEKEGLCFFRCVKIN